MGSNATTLPGGTFSVTANGLRLAYFEEGKGPLAILLHGFPDTPHTWREVSPALAKAGFRVVSPFLRGYPPSEAPSDGNYSALELGRDVIALIAALRAESAVVIGHDWGAFAAYAAASLAPDRVRKLVTSAIPHAGVLKPSLRTLWRSRHFIEFQLRDRAMAKLSRDGFAGVDEIYRRWSPSWSPDAAELKPVKEALAAPGGLEAALGYYASFRRDAFGSSGAEPRRVMRAPIAVPTLSFFGDEDGALDLSAIEATRAFFTGPYEFVRLPVGHFVHREAPKAFLERTLAFLSTQQ